MPKSSELIDMQYEFEAPRGLLEYNVPPHALHRLLEEVGEAWEELDEGRFREMLVEMADVVIFAHSILGWLARETGTSYEDVDRIIEDKMMRNFQKYHISHFEGRTTDEALQYSRDVWNG